jgi:probable rRNA maturation factor
MPDHNIFFHTECDFKLNDSPSYAQWVSKAIENEKRQVGDINYVFCDDKYLLEKNQTFLAHDTYTDIITFDYSVENTVSGDLFISIERVKENAKIFNHTFEQELKRVMIHGVLHLIGYGDKTESEQKVMTEKENLYLNTTN